MVDVLTPEQRRLNMSRIRGRDTKPEMILRRGLHALGLRFRLHRKDLPGRLDLVFPRYRAVIQVHDRRLRQELAAIDGATVLSFEGDVLAVGAIVKIPGGSAGGGRLAASNVNNPG